MLPEEEYITRLKAVESGDNSAKTKLAWFMLSGHEGAVVDVDKAVVLLRERVKDGDCEAMWMLGVCYELGIGTERDIEGAVKLYDQSHEEGNEIGEILKWNWYKKGSGKLGLSSL